MSLPLVTCLCLTAKGRQDYLSIAKACFGQQDYPNKELLIVPDSLDDLWKGWETEGPNGQSIMIPLRDRVDVALNVGAKRNVGCDAAGGELIAVWDDDDYSSPGRLSQQVAELQETSKAVTGYRVMKFTDGASWWQFSLPRGFVFGTSLMFTKAWWKEHPFLEINVGEDAGFASDAAEANQLAECPDLNLMYATIHKGNASKRKPTGDSGWLSLPGFEWKEKG